MINLASIAFATFVLVQPIRVIDGDTFTVNIPKWPAIVSHEISVRIHGIDTPELNSKCVREHILAIEAKNQLEEWLMTSKEIRLMNVRRGSFFRLIADVRIDNHDLSKMMIQRGVARPYVRGKHGDWCSLD